MTSRHTRRGHRLGALALFVLACAVIAAARAIEHLLPLVLLAAAGFGGWRLWRRHAARARVMPRSPGRDRRVISAGVVSSDSGRIEQLQAELSRIRRQVADLEDAAGRPIDAITATYLHLQRQYGPAAAGKAGGRP